jgi:hypothetical protein
MQIVSIMLLTTVALVGGLVPMSFRCSRQP